MGMSILNAVFIQAVMTCCFFGEVRFVKSKRSVPDVVWYVVAFPPPLYFSYFG